MKVECYTEDKTIALGNDTAVSQSFLDDLPYTQTARPIISLKEARKIIGKELSDQLSDEYLADIIRQFSSLSRAILDTITVPENE